MLHELTLRTPGTDPLLEGRRVLDTAMGILVGLRRCRVDAAFQELIDTGQRHDIPLFTIASALVSLASGDVQSQPTGRAAAHLAACQQWGQLLGTDISSQP